MAAKIQGSAHLFGISGGVGVITNATVVSFSLDKEHNNVTETLDELGNKIEDRRDDLHQTGTITLRPRSGFTPFVVGNQAAYNSVQFVFTSEGRAEEQSGHQVLTYNVLTTEYITLSP
jgi:hypothetical protein